MKTATTCWLVGVVCVVAAAVAFAQGVQPTVESWFSPAVQGKPPQERCQLLEAWAKQGLMRDAKFLGGIVARDPAREVKYCALEKVVQALDVKRADRVADAVTPPLRDPEMIFKVAETVYKVRSTDPNFKATVLNALVKWGAPLPYPKEIPVSGTIKVPWVSQQTGKPEELVMDAAQARLARDRVAKVVEMFNTVAGTNIEPGPKAGEELRTWNGKFGGKSIQADLWLARGIRIMTSPDQAKLVASTMLGTTGTEWFSGGGFQPDGTIVLAGTSLGPTLNFPGAKTKVLGTDQPAPPAPVVETTMYKYSVEPEYKPFHWNHAQGTPFVVRLAADNKRIVSVSRLPWTAGAVTSVYVDPQGNIYIAGPARDGIRKATGDAQDLDPAKKIERPPAKAGAAPPPPAPAAYGLAYVAKLTPAADKVLWVRLVDNPNQGKFAPEVRGDHRGNITFTSADQRVLTPDGKQVSRRDPIALNRLPSLNCAVDPDSGMVYYAGEHHWPTGHEPWRCPYVTINKADGSPHLTLYNWPGPYAGAAGLMADSPLFGARVDQNGDLMLMGWSDGGNSVLYLEPLDMFRGANTRGLGLSGAGVHGAIGFGYIVRVSTKNWRVIGGTMLCAATPTHGPNSMSVSDLAEAADRSLMMVGSSAWGAPQSTHNLCVGHPAGEYIGVLNKECSTLRFGASMQACGAAEVGNAKWGMATGIQSGRPMALFVSGALAKNNVYGREAGPPAFQPVQKEHAGGTVDGYFTLLDLSQPAIPSPAKPEENK